MTVDEIMALADEYRDWILSAPQSKESRSALRAAVEQLIDEADRHGRDADEQARLRIQWADAAMRCKERCERAERERDEARALLLEMRDDWARSPDPSGAYWVARIDAAFKEKENG